MPGLVWEIFASFIGILVLMTVSVYIVSPLLYGIADTYQNKTMTTLAFPNWRNYYDANTARDNSSAGWLAVGIGFPILSFVTIIAYVLRESNRQEDEQEYREIPTFKGEPA